MAELPSVWNGQSADKVNKSNKQTTKKTTLGSVEAYRWLVLMDDER